MKRALILTTAVTSAALVAACGSASPKAGKSADVSSFVTKTAAATKAIGPLNWNLAYEPTSVDPAKSANYSENQVLANICETLQKLKPDLTFGGDGLAKASNPDPMTWVYDIDPAATFSDGKPVTPEDVAYSLNRNLDVKVGSYWSFYYRNVSSIKVTGAHQVTVNLKTPDYVFNEGMASAAGTVIEKAYALKEGAKLGTSSGGIVCSGPFTLSSWVPGNSLTLKRNDNYWRTSARAKTPSIKFSFLADDTAQVNALTSGAIDGEYQVPFSSISKLKSSSNGTVYLGQTLIQYNLVVSATSGPMSDTRVRNALSMAIDRSAIAQTIFNGAAAPSSSLTTKAAAGYGQSILLSKAVTQPLPYDVAAAKKLLATVPNLRPLVFAYPTGAAAYNQQVALAVQAAAASIGLKITLKGIPNDTYQSAFFQPEVTKGVDILETPWYIDGPEPLVMYEQFLPKISPYNVSGYDNKTVNALINEASATADTTKRAQLIVQIQKLINRDLPWIPIVQEANTLYVSNKLGGLPAAFVQNYYPWAADVAGR